MIKHPIPPVYDENSEILILGSFPSVKSREQAFFYGHPQNRFWKVLSAVFCAEEPRTVEEKREFLLSHHLAVWDVIGSCEIVGSSDSSIKNAKPNDVGALIAGSRIERIFVNGKTAEKYYNKYLKEAIGKEAHVLPSTSPANAARSIEDLTAAWRIVALWTKRKDNR